SSPGADAAQPLTTSASPRAAASIPTRDFFIVLFSLWVVGPSTGSGTGNRTGSGTGTRSTVIEPDGGAMPDRLDGEHAHDDDDDDQVHQVVVVDLVAVAHREVADAAAADDAQHCRVRQQADRGGGERVDQ